MTPQVFLQVRPAAQAPAWWPTARGSEGPRAEAELAWVTLDPTSPSSWTIGANEGMSFDEDQKDEDGDLLLDVMVGEWLAEDLVECDGGCDEDCDDKEHDTSSEWEFMLVELTNEHD